MDQVSLSDIITGAWEEIKGYVLKAFKEAVEVVLLEEQREVSEGRLQAVLDNLQRRINCRLRKLDTDALERATELMERSLQQALEKIERTTKKLGSTTARLHRLGWVL